MVPIRVSVVIAFALGLGSTATADPPESTPPKTVKVAAVQISGYDKGELPRDNYDPSQSLLPFIDRAGREGAQLVVFPEYVLGHISIPGPETKRIAEAARKNSIYVIVGCWEEFDDGRFGKVLLELVNVFNPGAAPAIDRLIVVADHEGYAVLAC